MGGGGGAGRQVGGGRGGGSKVYRYVFVMIQNVHTIYGNEDQMSRYTKKGTLWFFDLLFLKCTSTDMRCLLEASSRALLHFCLCAALPSLLLVAYVIRTIFS